MTRLSTLTRARACLRTLDWRRLLPTALRSGAAVGAVGLLALAFSPDASPERALALGACGCILLVIVGGPV